MTERERIPPPLLKRRLPSGVGAMLQPNVTHDGDAALTVRFWIAVVATGVVTGLIGIALMELLRLGLLKIWLSLPVWCFRPRKRHG